MANILLINVISMGKYIIFWVNFALLLTSCTFDLNSPNQRLAPVSSLSVNETIQISTRQSTASPQSNVTAANPVNENEIFIQKQKCAEMKKSKEIELKALNQKNYDAVNWQEVLLEETFKKTDNIPTPPKFTENSNLKKEIKDFQEKMNAYHETLFEPIKGKPFKQKYIQESFYSHQRISCIWVMQEISDKNITTLSLEDLINWETIFSAIECSNKSDIECIQKRQELNIQYSNLKK